MKPKHRNTFDWSEELKEAHDDFVRDLANDPDFNQKGGVSSSDPLLDWELDQENEEEIELI